MKEIIFLLKMVGLSVVVALFLQVKVGENTAEQQFHGWLKSSFAVEWIQVAVDGGFAIAKTGYTTAKKTLDPLISKLHRKRSGHEEEDERSAGNFFSVKRKKPKPGEDEEMP